MDGWTDGRMDGWTDRQLIFDNRCNNDKAMLPCRYIFYCNRARKSDLSTWDNSYL